MENSPEQIKPNLFQTLSEKNLKRVELIRVFGSYTLEKIIEEKLPSIGSLQKTYGTEKVELAIAIVVKDLGKSFNNEISDDSALEIAAELTSSLLRNITLEGVYLTCQKIKRSEVKFKLTTNIIMRFLNQHIEDQSKVVMEKNYNHHLTTKFNSESERSFKKQEGVSHLSEYLKANWVTKTKGE